MQRDLKPPANTPTWLGRAAINAVRLALLIVLVWALFSEYLPVETPIAGDPAAAATSSRSTAEP